MVNHIVIWDYKDELNNEQRMAFAKEFKERIEALGEIVPGVIKIEAVINPLQSSNGDIMLVSSFESAEALNNYQVHDEHVKIGKLVGANTQNRKCVDYEV